MSQADGRTRSEFQDAVCAFVREILTARTGEAVQLTNRPDLEHRRIPAVEELWESPSRRYAVEHTRIESFEGQIENDAKLKRLLVPVRSMLAGQLPGTFVLTVPVRETKSARVGYTFAHREIVRLALQAAHQLTDGETTTLRSDRLPFKLEFHKRHGKGSQVFLHCVIEGDGDALRLDRLQRAFAEKLPKLRNWAADGRTSVLVLESDDIQLANVFAIFSAVKQALEAHSDQPDMIVLVETDGSPWNGWVLKDGDYVGNAVPMPDGRRCYVRGQLPSHL
jgi:hypothetical protein